MCCAVDNRQPALTARRAVVLLFTGDRRRCSRRARNLNTVEMNHKLFVIMSTSSRRETIRLMSRLVENEGVLGRRENRALALYTVAALGLQGRPLLETQISSFHQKSY